MSFKAYSLVVLLGLLMAASIGFSYLTGNQHTYLVDGLRMIDPELLKHDWFATQTTHYHGHFGAILWLINQVAPLGIGTISLNVFLIGVSVWALYQLLVTLDVERPEWAVVLLVGLMILTQSTSVGQSYIYSAYLQPSSIASVFFVLALVWFVKRAYFYSGLLLLVSGFFHTNFLLLGLAAFGLAHLMLGREYFVKRTALNMAPACLYLLYLLPGLLAMSASEFGEQSRYIYQHIRSPHHYIPSNYLEEFIKYFGISMLGLACGLLIKPAEQRLKSVFFVFLSLFIIVAVGTVLTTVVFIPFVSQLFPWRMAPFSHLLAQVLLVVFAFRLFNNKIELNRRSSIIASVGAVLVLTYYLANAGVGYLLAIGIAVIFTLIALGMWRSNYLNAIKSLPFLSVLSVLFLSVAVLVRVGDVTGEPNIKSLKQANLAYAQMDAKRLELLNGKYSADFAVFVKPIQAQRKLGRVVYENEKYLIINL